MLRLRKNSGSKFLKTTETKLAEYISEIIDGEKKVASWMMTRDCNFNCEYCFFSRKTGPTESLPVEKIINTLKSIGRKWIVAMTGGEPFLYPNFISICETLIKSNIKIAVDTNLSDPSKIQEFTQRIDPEDVSWIRIALHIEEREKRGSTISFIKSLLLLKKRGFIFNVDYVLYPPLLNRFKRDFGYFKSLGIELKAKPFIGIYKKKVYLFAYSEREKG